jgi:hypothetical protein
MVNWRIPVGDDYIKSLGRAVYAFSYLEWGVVWTSERLSPGFIAGVSKLTAGRIGKRFGSLAKNAPLDPAVVAELVSQASRFEALVLVRNDLIHSNPHTAIDGEQRLLRHSAAIDWTVARIEEATGDFELLAVEINEMFHSKLKISKHG